MKKKTIISSLILLGCVVSMHAQVVKGTQGSNGAPGPIGPDGPGRLYVGAGTSSIGANSTTTNLNVGIGTSSPRRSLEVVGSILASAYIEAGTFTTAGNIYAKQGSFSDNVGIGIGTRVPTVGLEVAGVIQGNAFTTTGNVNAASGYFNGNVGIGTLAPVSKLSVGGSITLGSGLENISARPAITANTLVNGEIRAYSKAGSIMDDGFIRMSAGGGTNVNVKSYIDLSGYSTIPDMDKNIVFGTSGVERLRIDQNGNLGIGTKSPDAKLTVNGNIHASEVKVDTSIPVPDYVFGNDYKLKTLQEVESYIKENSHLPEIPSAKEIEKNGLFLAEMNMNLLKKVEEVTLYLIQQNKEIEELKVQVKALLEKKQ